MASTSSQTRSSASTTLLPTSLMEAQEILLDSQNSPDYDGSNTFPAFLYPRPLAPLCFPADTSRPLSIVSGLDLYCSAQMTVRMLQSAAEDSVQTEPKELYQLFEEATPYLVSVGRKEPRSKATVKVVEDSKASNSPPSAMVYKRVQLPPCSRKIAPATSKRKARQIIVTDEDSTSNEVESEDENEEEDTVPPPKHLKTTSSISATLPLRSVKGVTKTAGKPAPECSPSSIFQPVLLVDAQGRLWLPNQSSGEFTPFPNAALSRC
ncbi:hypothetical protein GG344DRAFT_82593 [Lentinula edodes]|nr:hypothetical protein GG344DRAFT_82593 [Lentinula edodes]